MTDLREKPSIAALVGKAGEALVAAELMRRGTHVAYPAYDGGIDLLAYRELDFSRVVPIQVKARSGTCFHFQKSWFRIQGLVLIQVWHVKTTPEFYIFRSVQDVMEVLGDKHSVSGSWIKDGRYNVTNPKKGSLDLERMQLHRDRWDRVLDQLNP